MAQYGTSETQLIRCNIKQTITIRHDTIEKCFVVYHMPQQSGWNGQKLPSHASRCQEYCKCSHHQASVSTADSNGIAMVDIMWLGPMKLGL